MFAMRPNPYLGFQQPMQQPQIPPQMQGQVLQQPPMQGQQPPVGMQQLGMQLNPQLLAQLAQLHGMGLGGMRQQMPMFGRPSIQPIQSGAYSLR